MRDLRDISASLNDLPFDIRAEVVIADLIEAGVNPNDIVVVLEGLFSRRYTRDISGAGLLELNNGQKVIDIHVTRDGVYDALPEGLFHEQPVEPLKNGHEMARESKKQREEEREARKFFLPFENEIFAQKVQLELAERKLLHQLEKNFFDESFPQFWNIDRSLPKKYTSRLLVLLHFSSRIVGNIQLTASILEIILDEKVTCSLLKDEQIPLLEGLQHVQDTFSLGSGALGVDFVCGENSMQQLPVMEFVIGPLKNSLVNDYLGNGQVAKFLKVFYNYFVPMELDVITRIELSKEKQSFKLDEKSPAFLGYNSAL